MQSNDHAVLCECGCGSPVGVWPRNVRARGRVKGEYKRFVSGHNVRVNHPRKPGAPEMQDMGYKTPCHLWTGAVDSGGYGWTHRGDRRLRSVHRIYYEERYGPIPEGLQLDHLCRTPACCNPEHLEAVTSAENTRRGRAAKLDVEKVRRIRCLREGKGLTYARLARMFGVRATCIGNVVNRVTWYDA